MNTNIPSKINTNIPPTRSKNISSIIPVTKIIKIPNTNHLSINELIL